MLIVIMRSLLILFIVIKDVWIIPSLAFNLTLLDGSEIFLWLESPSIKIIVVITWLLKKLTILVLLDFSIYIATIKCISSDHVMLFSLPDLVCLAVVSNYLQLLHVGCLSWWLLHYVLTCLAQSAFTFLLINIGHIHLVYSFVTDIKSIFIDITSSS